MTMRDAWVAECIPCKEEQHFATQDEAIAAAEEHIDTAHKKTPAHERAARRIGHVQQRTVAVDSAPFVPFMNALCSASDTSSLPESKPLGEDTAAVPATSTAQPPEIAATSEGN